MKELSIEEVLRIAGGLPAAAALDEVTYLAPAVPAPDSFDFARLLEGGTKPADAS
jgi:hypothetical protein